MQAGLLDRLGFSFGLTALSLSSPIHLHLPYPYPSFIFPCPSTVPFILHHPTTLTTSLRVKVEERRAVRGADSVLALTTEGRARQGKAGWQGKIARNGSGSGNGREGRQCMLSLVWLRSESSPTARWLPGTCPARLAAAAERCIDIITYTLIHTYIHTYMQEPLHLSG